MPTTKDGKQFPYTADGILAAKRHEEYLRKSNDQRTMDNSTNGEKTDKDKLPPYVKPRHLDPNHPMNQEGPPKEQETQPEKENSMFHLMIEIQLYLLIKCLGLNTHN